MSEFVYDNREYSLPNSSADKLIKYSCIILYSRKYSMAYSGQKSLKEYVRNNTHRKISTVKYTRCKAGRFKTMSLVILTSLEKCFKLFFL